MPRDAILNAFFILKLFKLIRFNRIWTFTEIQSPSGHPRSGYVCFYIWTDLDKFSIESLLQWMGAVRMRVQTADKNITLIHK